MKHRYEQPVAIEYRINGDTAILDFFIVPDEQQRQGVGRCAYSKWEKSLPLFVHKVVLEAIDDSGPFWRKMGFMPLYRGSDDPDFEIPERYVKGINGHSTPTPIEYDFLDDVN